MISHSISEPIWPHDVAGPNVEIIQKKVLTEDNFLKSSLKGMNASKSKEDESEYNFSVRIKMLQEKGSDIIHCDQIRRISTFFAYSTIFSVCSRAQTLMQSTIVPLQPELSILPIRFLGDIFYSLDFSQHYIYPSWQPSSESMVSKIVQLKHITERILSVLQHFLWLRQGELLYALMLLEKAITGRATSKSFKLSFENASMALLISVMISHKCNCDTPLPNKWWSNLFNISLNDVNQSEIVLLQAVAFHVPLSSEVYSLVAETWDRINTVPLSFPFITPPH